MEKRCDMAEVADPGGGGGGGWSHQRTNWCKRSKRACLQVEPQSLCFLPAIDVLPRKFPGVCKIEPHGPGHDAFFRDILPFPVKDTQPDRL